MGEFHYWATLLIPAISSAIVGWFLARRVHAIHISLNSRLTQLIENSRELGHAEGLKAGQLGNVVEIAKVIANVADVAKVIAGHPEGRAETDAKDKPVP